MDKTRAFLPQDEIDLEIVSSMSTKVSTTPQGETAEDLIQGQSRDGTLNAPLVIHRIEPGSNSGEVGAGRKRSLVMPILFITCGILAVAFILFFKDIIAQTLGPATDWVIILGCTVASLGIGLLIGGYVFSSKGQSHSSQKPGLARHNSANMPQTLTSISSVKVAKSEADSIGVDKTVALGSAKCAALKAVRDELTIVINKEDFSIGRNPDVCDYAISYKHLGRMHARIKSANGNFFLMDLASINGTFINGERLGGYKEYQLQDNDNVAFADMDFYFKLL